MRFLITGHTGFKGSWLSLLLLERGHEVNGVALEPIVGSLFDKTNLGLANSLSLALLPKNRPP